MTNASGGLESRPINHPEPHVIRGLEEPIAPIEGMPDPETDISPEAARHIQQRAREQETRFKRERRVLGCCLIILLALCMAGSSLAFLARNEKGEIDLEKTFDKFADIFDIGNWSDKDIARATATLEAPGTPTPLPGSVEDYVGVEENNDENPLLHHGITLENPVDFLKYALAGYEKYGDAYLHQSPLSVLGRPPRINGVDQDVIDGPNKPINLEHRGMGLFLIEDLDVLQPLMEAIDAHVTTLREPAKDKEGEFAIDISDENAVDFDKVWYQQAIKTQDGNTQERAWTTLHAESLKEAQYKFLFALTPVIEKFDPDLDASARLALARQVLDAWTTDWWTGANQEDIQVSTGEVSFSLPSITVDVESDSWESCPIYEGLDVTYTDGLDQDGDPTNDRDHQDETQRRVNIVVESDHEITFSELNALDPHTGFLTINMSLLAESYDPDASETDKVAWLVSALSMELVNDTQGTIVGVPDQYEDHGTVTVGEETNKWAEMYDSCGVIVVESTPGPTVVFSSPVPETPEMVVTPYTPPQESTVTPPPPTEFVQTSTPIPPTEVVQTATPIPPTEVVQTATPFSPTATPETKSPPKPATAVPTDITSEQPTAEPTIELPPAEDGPPAGV